MKAEGEKKVGHLTHSYSAVGFDLILHKTTSSNSKEKKYEPLSQKMYEDTACMLSFEIVESQTGV